MQEERVAWHPKERLPMKLAVLRSENIEVYISNKNSIQGNGQKLNELDIGALTTSNDERWQNFISIAQRPKEVRRVTSSGTAAYDRY